VLTNQFRASLVGEQLLEFYATGALFTGWNPRAWKRGLWPGRGCRPLV